MKLKLEHLRVFIQALALVFMTQLFTLGFMGFNKIYASLLEGRPIKWDSPAVITALLLVLGCILLGRFFCGWFCAFGTINDFLHKFFTALTGRKLVIPQRIGKYLVYLKYIVLVSVVVFIWTLDMRQLDDISPWHAFGSLLKTPLRVLEYPVSLIVLIVVLGAGMVFERFFCRYLCPLGAIQALLSHLRITAICAKSSLCNNCSRCKKECPMGIDPFKKEKVNSAECISCYKCLSSCYPRSLSLKAVGKSVPVKAVVIFGILLLSSSSLFFLVQSDDSLNTITKQDEIIGYENKLYKDGTYEGRGFAYRPGFVVQVTFRQDKIVDIKITEHRETRGYFEEAFEDIPKQIISKQSTDYTSIGVIDVVSGATATSMGICNVVDRAAAKASEALQLEKEKQAGKENK